MVGLFSVVPEHPSSILAHPRFIRTDTEVYKPHRKKRKGNCKGNDIILRGCKEIFGPDEYISAWIIQYFAPCWSKEASLATNLYKFWPCLKRNTYGGPKSE